MSSVSTVPSNIDANVRPVSKHDYSELPDPSIQVQPMKPSQRRPPVQGNNNQRTTVPPRQQVAATQATKVSSGGANTDNSATHKPNGRLIDG